MGIHGSDIPKQNPLIVEIPLDNYIDTYFIHGPKKGMIYEQPHPRPYEILEKENKKRLTPIKPYKTLLNHINPA